METLKAKAIATWDVGDYERARVNFEQVLDLADTEADKENSLFNAAACLGAAGEFDKALEILSRLSPDDDTVYNKALCQYKLSNLNEALRTVDQLIVKHRKTYSDTSSRETIGIDDKLIQNSCIIEALNLKFSILFKLNQPSLAAQCINQVPIKDLTQWDGVSLHNKAISDPDSATSIHKLVHLSALDEDSCPPQTFRNLIILYLQNGQYRLAQEFMQSNEGRLTDKLKHYFSIFMDDLLKPDDQIYMALDQLLERTLASDRDIEFSLTIASHQAKILWRNNQYEALENLLNKLKVHLSAKEQLDWIDKNMAHALYMQDTRFEDSLQLYEKQMATGGSLADVNVVCNLCVAYVLTGRNGDAEMLIKRMERQEEEEEEEAELSSDEAEPEVGRLCQMNLIIGTLYCVKHNYEFGLARMFKAVEPFEAHLSPTTWWLVKRCLLSMLDLHCKQVICPKDDLLEQSIGFLVRCEQWAQSTDNGQGRRQQLRREWAARLAYESRQVRSLLLSALHD